jgi:hypothetical protein
MTDAKRRVRSGRSESTTGPEVDVKRSVSQSRGKWTAKYVDTRDAGSTLPAGGPIIRKARSTLFEMLSGRRMGIAVNRTAARPRKSWLQSPVSFGARVLLVGGATYVAVDASRLVGYPNWALVAFGVLGALIFVVQIRSEQGRLQTKQTSTVSPRGKESQLNPKD